MGRSTLSTARLRQTARAVGAAAALVLAVGIPAGVAGAQTTTAPTTPVTAPVASTAVTTLAVPTTAAGGATTTTTTVLDEPTQPLIAENTTKSSTPWLAIALIAVGVIILVVLLVLALRRRGSGDDPGRDAGSTRSRGGPRGGAARAAWRERAAAATAEAGACVRQVATGAAVTGPIVSQLVTSIRSYGEMAGAAPDDDCRQLVERARRALQGLGQQIDADHQVRRAQPPADPERLAASARAVSETAGETDRVLRSVYRELNDPE